MKRLNSAREYPLRRQSCRDKGQQETEKKHEARSLDNNLNKIQGGSTLCLYSCVMEHKIDLRRKKKLRMVPMATLMYSRILRMGVSFGKAYGKQEGLVTTMLNGFRK